MLEHLRTTNPIAIINHRCSLCLTTITTGILHHAATMSDDGHLYTFRAHLGCWAVVSNHPEGEDPDVNGYTSNSFEWVCEDLAADDPPRWPLELLHAYDALPLAEQARILEHVGRYHA